MAVFSGAEVELALDIDSFKVPVHDHAGECLAGRRLAGISFLSLSLWTHC